MRDLIDLCERTVYHGSPHSFASFDTSYIGTGEGNATYGWGLYFADAKAVADKYSRDIADAGQFFTKSGRELKQPDLIAAAHRAVEAAKAKGYADPVYPREDGPPIHASSIPLENTELLLKRGSGANMVEFLRGDAKRFRGHAPEAAAFYKIIAAMFAKLEWRPGRGKVYHVEISDTSSFLNWTAAVADQPKAVIRAMAAQNGFSAEDDATGRDFYRWLSGKEGGDRQASQKLLGSGVGGIVYRDRASRTSDDPTFNYVVFDHDLVTITKAEEFSDRD